jgi:hypothetical protein
VYTHPADKELTMAKTALDLVTDLLQVITLEQIAQEAGIAKQTLRQYRLPEGNQASRNASPAAQEALLKAVAKLARAQAAHFTKLAERAAR